MPTIPLTIKIRDYTYSTNITIPSVTSTPETPIPVCTPPQILNPFSGKCEECKLPQVYNYITGKCETPELPTPPPKLICQVGEQQKTQCPDGTEIVSAECQKDFVAGTNKWVLTGNVCPPKVEMRIVKILPEGEKRLPDANSGETVKITATAICKTTTTTSKPRDTAYLIVDGAVADIKVIEGGIVTFDWEATAIPISIHTICVKVNPSVNCKSPGQDCKHITVSSAPLDIAAQLASERSSAAEQRKLIEQARSKLRSEIIGAELEVPSYTYTPPYTSPYIPPTTPPTIPPTTPPTTPPPTTPPTIPPTIPPTTPPPTDPITEYGNISIIGLPATLIPITSALPIYLYIDTNNIGRIYELPKTITNIATGVHYVYAVAGTISTPPRTAIVTKDKTTTVTL